MQVQLHQQKIRTGDAVLALEGILDITHAFVSPAVSHHVLCHSPTILRVPSRTSTSKPGHILALHPAQPLHGSSFWLLTTGNKLNKPTNQHKPLVACNYTATLTTLLRSLPSHPAQSQVLLPLCVRKHVPARATPCTDAGHLPSEDVSHASSSNVS